MERQFRPLAFAVIRTSVMVSLATLLILVLLPAVLTAQAATAT
jgi:hypothetical protein